MPGAYHLTRINAENFIFLYKGETAKLPHYAKAQAETATAAETPAKLRAVRPASLIILLYATGLRISELVALKACIFTTAENYSIIRGKGGKQHIARQVAVLRQYFCIFLQLSDDCPRIAPPRLAKNSDRHKIFGVHGGN